jgi:hypothetical protein
VLTGFGLIDLLQVWRSRSFPAKDAAQDFGARLRRRASASSLQRHPLGDEHGNMRQQGNADSPELTAKSC